MAEEPGDGGPAAPLRHVLAPVAAPGRMDEEPAGEIDAEVTIGTDTGKLGSPRRGVDHLTDPAGERHDPDGVWVRGQRGR